VQFDLGGNGQPDEGLVGTGLPLLSGDRLEPLVRGVGSPERTGPLWVWKAGATMAGYAEVERPRDLEGATQEVYSEVLRISGHLTLYRLWNFVPDINGTGPGALENYRAFCLGRSIAFESAFGRGFTRNLPAASAVGTAGDILRVVFLAGDCPVRHHENPSQLPAYEYPQEHGPRSPSFSRATVVSGPGTLDAYISGTSSVKGHETIAPGDTARQVYCTFENLRLISEACGMGASLGTGAACKRHFKVYLRNEADLALVSAAMAKQGIVRPGDSASYLRADICRSALNVEIEVAVRGAERA